MKSYVVTGQDAEKASVQYIIDGKQSMTVFKDVRTLVDDAISAAVSFAKGETPAATNKYNNGKIDVPAMLFEPMVLDKKNVMQTVIKDGYHKLEDVYKNVPKDQWPKQ